MVGLKMFSTIIHKKEDGAVEIYHGIVMEKYNDFFVFGFRVFNKNYIWNCYYDYWQLIEK